MVTAVRVPAGGRVAVIGDIGGHVDALRSELVRLGVPDDGDGPIPPDLRIIQVGDLVHRGPDSAGVIALVDKHLREHDHRWIQLIGNHEAYYLRRKQFNWPEKLPPPAIATLRDWWTTGLAQPAAAVRIQGDEFVVTHAGVTRGFWRDVLGGPINALAAARRINALVGIDENTLFRCGAMVDAQAPDPLVGPIWAAAGSELVASWLGHDLPFNQIHGHTSVFDWDTEHWYIDEATRPLVERDSVAKHVTVNLLGGRLIGVDPGNEALGRDEWRSLVDHRT